MDPRLELAETKGFHPNYAKLPVPPHVSCPVRSAKDIAVFIPCYDVRGFRDGEYYLRSALWARYSIYRWTDAVEQGVRVYLYTTAGVAHVYSDLLAAAGVSEDSLKILEREDIAERLECWLAYKVKLLYESFLKEYERVCIWDADLFAEPNPVGHQPFFSECRVLTPEGIYGRDVQPVSIASFLFRLVDFYGKGSAGRYFVEQGLDSQKAWDAFSAPLKEMRFSDTITFLQMSLYFLFPKSPTYLRLAPWVKKYMYTIKWAHDEILVTGWAQLHGILPTSEIKKFEDYLPSRFWCRHKDVRKEEADKWCQWMIEGGEPKR